ncbi:SDR family oxidoreductase [Oenococcus sp. UCMA 16435]|nr:SDR family oxidoreductase [Oenococcus sp. UCMA 16435]MDI4584460.1 SDR family oxidoreductase [Oenococcus sp. UCMA 14587]
MLTLKGRTMIITGGAGNNGLAIAKMALEYGMNVAFMSSFHGKALGAVNKFDPKYKEQLIGFAQNPQARLAENIECDPNLYNENTTQEDVLGWIYEKFGSIDVVINGSQGHDRHNMEETDKKIWKHSMEVVEAAFFNTKLALPYLKKSESPRVINLTTSDGKNGGWYPNPSFAASRGGVVNLTYEMAKELGHYGITVNCVLTGHIEDDVPEEDTLSPEMRRVLLARTALGRLGVPEDVAGAVNFLASEESSFITGAVIDVNGGAIMG